MSKQRSLLLFEQAIKSKATLKNYKYHLENFMKWAKIKNYDGLLQAHQKDIQILLEDYVIYLKSKISSNSVSCYFSPIELFYVMNDVTINYRKIRKLFPEKTKKGNGRAYTLQEIQKMLSHARTLRNKTLVLLLASSGCRIGAIPDIRLRHLTKIESSYCILIYEGDKEEDFIFKEKIQDNKLFSEISKILSKEIIEKSKANEYSSSLIITYLDIKQSFNFDLQLFQNILFKISNIDKKPTIVNCYVPIYGLESNFKSFELPCNLLTIKQITPLELDTITNLSILNSKHAVGKRFRNLQYVAHFSFDLEKDDSLKKKYLLQDSLRLTKSGFLKVGDAFYRYVPGLKGMFITPKIGEEQPPNLSTPLIVDNSDQKKLYDNIFQNLKNLRDDYDEDKIRYINSAIRRFGYVYNASDPEDKISDLIIAMETLLSNDPIEIGVKMSLRVAMLLGDTEESKQSIQQFIKKCYSKRSEIVHGKKKKPFVIDGNDLPYETVVELLENYVRDAINKVLILHMKKKSQQTLLDDLDSIIINRHTKNLLN